VKHRGVSEVIGSVIMLGVVGAIAALVLTLGLSSITDFQTFLIDVDITEDTLKEKFIVEYTSFTVNAKTVVIYFRNIGHNTITIESIAITDIDTQDLLLLETSVDDFTSGLVIQPKTREDITVTADSCMFIVDTPCVDTNYLISIVTSRGNIYEIEVIPFRA